jgi:hypothetical protein
MQTTATRRSDDGDKTHVAGGGSIMKTRCGMKYKRWDVTGGGMTTEPA